MTPERVRELNCGLYRLHFGEEDSVLAAVGVDAGGWHWYAATNWVSFLRSGSGALLSDWSGVTKAEPLRLNNEETV